ncbi:MAG: DUF5317 domain-containing protein [Sedimentibacter sp.]
MVPEILILTLISIIILLIRKKTLDLSLLKLEIKGYQILILAAAIEITAEFLFNNFSNNNYANVLSFHWLIYFAIFVVTSLNFKKPFMKLLFIGTLLNFIAIVSNDFKMPVLVSEVLANAEEKKIYLQTGQNLIHSLLTEDTKFKILCDIITLPPPYPFPKTISIGDVFLLLGIFTVWQEPTNTDKQQSNEAVTK